MKVFLFIAVFLTLGLFIRPGNVYAQSKFNVAPTSDQHVEALSDYAQNGNQNRDAYTTGSFGNILQSITDYTVGVNDPQTGVTLVPGAIPGMGKAIAFLIKNRSVGTDIYIADLIQHAPFTKQAYAQGLGFQALTPVLAVWKVFRDLTYLVYVLVFVVIGFMIMFRSKLSGNVVVTVESALPNLITTLLLITFSYAIAGLLIDVMYLAIYLVVGIFSQFVKAPNGTSLTNIALSNNIFENGIKLIFSGNNNGASIVGNAASAVSTIATDFFSGVFGKDATFVNGLFGGLAGIIGAVVFALAVFFAVVQTFFILLKAYVSFIINVIFAPFQLIGGVLTGKSAFGDWINGLLASLAAFPVVIVMLFLALLFGGGGINGAGYQAGATGLTGGFSPPLISIRGTSGNAAYAFQAIIAIGILMLMPEALKMTTEFFHAKNPLEKYMPAISKGFQKGWKGDEAIPGLAFTKIPGAESLTTGFKKFEKSESGVGRVLGGGLVRAPQRVVYEPVKDQVEKRLAANRQRRTEAQRLTPSALPPTATTTPSGTPTGTVRTTPSGTPVGPREDL